MIYVWGVVVLESLHRFMRWSDIQCSGLSDHRPHQELDFDCVLLRKVQARPGQGCPMSPLGNIIWIVTFLMSSNFSVLPATLHPAGSQRQQLLGAGYHVAALACFHQMHTVESKCWSKGWP